MQRKRSQWIKTISGANAEHQIYLDESGINTNLTRHYAHAVHGKRAMDATPINTPVGTTVLSSIRLNGSLVYTTYQGGTTVQRFREYMGKQLIPSLEKDDVVIMDMEAGLEHLGRGTTESVDQFIVVIEPGARSIQTYKNVKRLASDLGVKQVRVVANKVRNEEDEAFVKSKIPEEDLLGFIHYNTEVMDADRQGKSPYDFSKTVTDEIIKIKKKIEEN